MKNILEMGSVGIITILNFIKIGSSVQTLLGGICLQMKQQDYLMSLLLFLKSEESRPNMGKALKNKGKIFRFYTVTELYMQS